MTTRRRRSPTFRCGYPRVGSGLPCWQEVGEHGKLCATHRKANDIDSALAAFDQHRKAVTQHRKAVAAKEKKP